MKNAPPAGAPCPACNPRARYFCFLVHAFFLGVEQDLYAQALTELQDLGRFARSWHALDGEATEFKELREAAVALVDRYEAKPTDLDGIACMPGFSRLQNAYLAWRLIQDRHFADRRHSHGPGR